MAGAAIFGKLAKVFANFWSIYFILFYMCEQHKELHQMIST